MIIAVLALGGAMLGATTISGLLILYQIRGATDSENSAKAIFAADAGVEYALYDFYCPYTLPAPRCAASPPDPASSTFSNGAVTILTCYDAANASISCGNASAATAISKGTSLNSRRAFFLDMRTATSSLP
jgi:hypothetical protein